MQPSGAPIVHQAAGPAGWESAAGIPDARLRPLVRGYSGYVERTDGPLRRKELPSGDVVLIISFGPSLRLLDPVDPARAGSRTSFVAGLRETVALTEHDGQQHGVEVNLSPLAAGMLLGVPMGEVANRVVELDDLLGPTAGELAERLHGAPTWDERFALLDVVLSQRLAAARAPSPEVVRALARLTAAHGRVQVGALAQEVGWSRRHLVARFREQVGLPPKVVARILRFSRAVALFQRDDGLRFAEIAHRCGYYDQAHLNRDFRAFAGGPPGDFLARRLPGGGVSGA
jgi:AraC-like DNA-binding protein